MKSAPTPRTLFRRAALAGAALLLIVTAASAHPLQMTRADFLVDNEGNYTLTVDADIVAQLLNASSGHVPQFLLEDFRAMTDEEVEGNYLPLRQRIEHEWSVRFNGIAVPPTNVTFPDIKALRASATSDPRPATRIVATGRVPDGAATVSIKLPDQFAPVQLTVQVGDREPVLRLLESAEASGPIALGDTNADDAAAAPGAAAVTETKASHVAADYLVLGYEHILPQGLDHILFVLGLFLLSPKLKPLLMQVTAFTVAHSVTLALSMYDVVSLPASIVEPLIAASIVMIAVENVLSSELKPWRVFVVFAFGLLHGLGFAGVLAELGLPRGHFVTALVSFNVGVECGQLSVIALAMLAVGWFRHRKWYRTGIVVPLSLCIAMIGAYWTVQRIFY